MTNQGESNVYLVVSEGFSQFFPFLSIIYLSFLTDLSVK